MFSASINFSFHYLQSDVLMKDQVSKRVQTL